MAVRLSSPSPLKANYRATSFTSLSGQPRLSFEVENASEQIWNSAAGFAVNYRIFDAATGIPLLEGERVPFPRELKPGERLPFTLPLEIPKDPGLYRIHAGAIREDGGWADAGAAPFILLDVRVASDGIPQPARPRVTDLAEIRRKRRLQLVPRALIQPFSTVWRNRSLSATLVKREILSRSRGSFFGSLWTVLNPLLLMVTYFFVFGIVLKARFGGDPSRTMFALYFLAGMMPWLAFSEAAGRAPVVLIEYRQLIKKLVFPIETLPVNLVWSGLIGELFGLALFTLACLVIRHGLPATVLYLPLLLIPQVLFTAGVCWFLSVLGAFLRDLSQVNGFLLTLWFFVTPICYPETQIPPGARRLLVKNPIFILVRGYRAIFLEAHAPDWKSLAELTVFSILLAVLAHAWFYKLRKSFIDVL